MQLSNRRTNYLRVTTNSWIYISSGQIKILYGGTPTSFNKFPTNRSLDLINFSKRK